MRSATLEASLERPPRGTPSSLSAVALQACVTTSSPLLILPVQAVEHNVMSWVMAVIACPETLQPHQQICVKASPYKAGWLYSSSKHRHTHCLMQPSESCCISSKAQARGRHRQAEEAQGDAHLRARALPARCRRSRDAQEPGGEGGQGAQAVQAGAACVTQVPHTRGSPCQPSWACHLKRTCIVRGQYVSCCTHVHSSVFNLISMQPEAVTVCRLMFNSESANT